MGRKRKQENEGLPPNLYKRKEIFYYRDPRTKIEYSLGKNKSLAVTETLQANISIYKPKASLVDRINNIKVITFSAWLDDYYDILEKRELKPKSLKDYRSRVAILKKHFPNISINEVTTKDISSFINSYPKPTMAKLLRSTLSDAFNEAIANGLVSNNPVSITKSPKVKIQRSRLTLEQFNIAVKNADKQYANIFLLSLLTAQRIGDIVNMKWSDIKDNRLFIKQSKTGAKIAILLDIKLNAVNATLNQVLSNLKNNRATICNTSADSLRYHFNNALPESENKPTFHEIRSLSARLYEEEKGAEFAKNILGHKSMAMTDRYLDDRNNDYFIL